MIVKSATKNIYGYPPDSSRWIYKENGSPKLSGAQIESITSALVKIVAPQCLIEPTPLPIQDILKFVVEDTGLKYTFADLGPKSDFDLRGVTRFKEGVILLDHTFRDDPSRFQYLRFTIAHELGHWILQRHQPIYLTEDGPPAEFLEDEISDFTPQIGSGPRTLRQWIEWQANKFASSLTMPSRAMIRAMAKVNLDCGDTLARAKYLYINSSPEGRTAANRRLQMIAAKFGTSPKQVEYRLEALELLKRQTSEHAVHPLYEEYPRDSSEESW